MTSREVWARLAALIRRHELDREFEDEIATHLELAKADNLRAGMDPEEARRLAAIKFGSIMSAKQGVWDQRRTPRFGSILQDARYAIRGMRKSPGFTVVTALTLGLGIGLCSVMFALVNAMLLRPLPAVPEPGRLALMQAPVTYPHFEMYRDQSRATAAMAAFLGPVPISVATENPTSDGAERIFGQLVSLEYFSTLGVEPLLGRFFNPALERPGAAPTVVLSERFWRTHLHSNPQIVGSTIRVNGRRAIIIGVGPKDFLGVLIMPKAPEIFIPVTADPSIAPELHEESGADILHRTTQPAFRVLLRLASGITMAAEEASLDAQTRHFDPDHDQLRRDPSARKGRLARLIPAGTAAPMPAEARSMIEVFYGLLVALILSLTCANLAGLILARGSARGREIAIRLSVGADRWRLVRQLLTKARS